jgi:hypothetical protein
MNTATHPVAPEDIMALLDGELSAGEAQEVSQHLAQCAECAAVASEFRATSQIFAQWNVPQPSPELDRRMAEHASEAASKQKSVTPRTVTTFGHAKLRFWAFSGGGAVAAVLVIVIIALFIPTLGNHRTLPPQGLMAKMEATAPEPTNSTDHSAYAYSAMPPVPLPQVESKAESRIGGIVGGNAPNPTPAPAPMIARTVSLVVLVKNIEVSRAALDGILDQHRGYTAQLTINTPESGARSFQASLRVPAPDLAASLAALRSLGAVQSETQSGEEVSQQHADLAARLTNARETEQRLREILQQRTGKMEDVLEVEEKISETRGEIESMEAEQKALEHRVDFATIDVQLTEEYKAQLNGTSTPVGTNVHNAFVAGMRHAGSALLGLVLFAEEYGPVFLIWICLLGVPAFIFIRRYRRAQRSL